MHDIAHTQLLGIDIGGSGVKGAPVDISLGVLTADRTRIATPKPATPTAIAATVQAVVESFPEVGGPIGCTFPAIVRAGRVGSAAHVDASWVDTDAAAILTEQCGREVVVLNDADAAGMAETQFGNAPDRGVVLVLTFGTGIGSALFVDGVLVPNTELGHLEIDGRVAETFASGKVRKEQNLSFAEWASVVNRYLAHVERLFSPDCIVVGGGISKKFSKFGHLLDTAAEIRAASLRNDAGIVGAATWAATHSPVSNSR